MFKVIHGDMFKSKTQTIVNPVNTVGVMGKGLALKFKQMYPDMFNKYRYFCKNGYLTIGKLWIYRSNNRWILNFPTKQNWRDPSKLEYIRVGLQKFVSTYKDQHVTSVAFPKLGAGLGGLSWKTQVEPLMKHYLDPINIPCYVYII